MNVATVTSRETVGVRQLKNQLSAILELVKQGAEVTVTEHGQPIARLTTVSPEVDHMAELIHDGLVRPATAKRRLPSRRVKGDPAAFADAVSAQRR